MLARLRWRSRRLVRHDIQSSFAETITFGRILIVFIDFGKVDIGYNPVAYLAPFRVVSAGRIWITYCDRELWNLVFAPNAGELVQQLYFWLLLCFGWVDGVAIFRCGVLPGDRNCQQRQELVDDGWNDLSLLEPISPSESTPSHRRGVHTHI